mgnify:FL=1
MEKKYKYLPEEMKVLKRFVGWRREDLEGKVAKLPFSLLDGKASRLISGASLTGDHSRDDFTFLVLARNYTDGNPNLMKELFLMTPLNRLATNEKRRDDRKYLDYVEKTIEKVLGLGNFVAFDWSRHFQYKKRTKAYERV